MLFVVICNYLFSMMIGSIFLFTQPQINTSIYPTIKICHFVAPKTQKIRGLGFTSKSSKKPYFKPYHLSFPVGELIPLSLSSLTIPNMLLPPRYKSKISLTIAACSSLITRSPFLSFT